MIIGLVVDTNVTQGAVAGDIKTPDPAAQTGQSFARVLANQTAAATRGAQPLAPAQPEQAAPPAPDPSDEDDMVLTTILTPEDEDNPPAPDLLAMDEGSELLAQTPLPDDMENGDMLPAPDRTGLSLPRGEAAHAALHDGTRDKLPPSDTGSAVGRGDTAPVTRKRPLTAVEFHIAPQIRQETPTTSPITTAGYAASAGSMAGPLVPAIADMDAAAQDAVWQAGPADATADMPAAQLAGALAAGQDLLLGGGRAAPVGRAKYGAADISYVVRTPEETAASPDYQTRPQPTPAQPQTDTLLQTDAFAVEQLLNQATAESQVQTSDPQTLAASENPTSQVLRATGAMMRAEAALSSSVAQALQTVSENGQGVFELDIWDGVGGKLRISVSAIDGAVQISMLSGRVDMLDLLKRSLNLLRDDLTALGFKSIDLKLVNAGAATPLHQLQVSHPATRPRADMVFDTPSSPPRPAGIDLRL
ncbi:MAG: hypothetical protein IKG52_08140 [Rhodobacteraceae bacterium]|nr:hypothetical protein [Paracoccaceae bacterium]